MSILVSKYDPNWAAQFEELKKEMIERGYNHKSDIEEVDCQYILDLLLEKQYWKIDKKAALEDLLSRCPDCRSRNPRQTVDEIYG